jgi:hypothetical protein
LPKVALRPPLPYCPIENAAGTSFPNDLKQKDFEVTVIPNCACLKEVSHERDEIAMPAPKLKGKYFYTIFLMKFEE